MYRYTGRRRAATASTGSCRVEAIGSDDPAVDAEVIQLYDELLRRARRRRLRARAQLDRRPRVSAGVRRAAERWLDEHDDELDEEARQKRATTPLRVFDVKSERVQAALADAPKIGESLCDDVPRAFRRGASALDAYGVAYELDADTRPRARLLHAHHLRVLGPTDGAKDTICGGGRYDGLVEEIGGPPTPGIGFGAGLERLLLAIEREASPRSRGRSTSSSWSTRARPEPRHAAPRRAPRAAACARHRLRRPLAQGPADAGAAAGSGADRRSSTVRTRPCASKARGRTAPLETLVDTIAG